MEFSLTAARDVFPLLMRGAVATLYISLAAFAFSLVGGLLIWLLNSSRFTALSLVSRTLSDFIRSTPLLVQVFFVYFVGPGFGLVLSPVATGILTLGVHNSCYMAQVYRAAYQAVPIGQWNAAEAIGLSKVKGFALVIVPQMIPAFIPLAGGYLIYIFKETPILATVTVHEMLFEAQKYGADHFRYLEPFTLAGLIFLAMSLVTAYAIRKLEARSSVWARMR